MKPQPAHISIGPRANRGPPGYGQILPLDPRRSAVVIVDVQKYFVEALPFEVNVRTELPVFHDAVAVIETGRRDLRADGLIDPGDAACDIDERAVKCETSAAAKGGERVDLG